MGNNFDCKSAIKPESGGIANLYNDRDGHEAVGNTLYKNVNWQKSGNIKNV